MDWPLFKLISGASDDDFKEALHDLIVNWHDEEGTSYEEIIEALELELMAAKDQHRDETSG